MLTLVFLSASPFTRCKDSEFLGGCQDGSFQRLLIQGKCQKGPWPSSKVNTWNHKIWASSNIGLPLFSFDIFSIFPHYLHKVVCGFLLLNSSSSSPAGPDPDEVEIRTNFEEILFSQDEFCCFVSKCPNFKKTSQKCEFWRSGNQFDEH